MGAYGYLLRAAVKAKKVRAMKAAIHTVKAARLAKKAKVAAVKARVLAKGAKLHLTRAAIGR